MASFPGKWYGRSSTMPVGWLPAYLRIPFGIVLTNHAYEAGNDTVAVRYGRCQSDPSPVNDHSSLEINLFHLDSRHPIHEDAFRMCGRNDDWELQVAKELTARRIKSPDRDRCRSIWGHACALAGIIRGTGLDYGSTSTPRTEFLPPGHKRCVSHRPSYSTNNCLVRCARLFAEYELLKIDHEQSQKRVRAFVVF